MIKTSRTLERFRRALRLVQRAALWSVVIASALCGPRTTRAEDCDHDGVDDAEAIAEGAARDCDANGVPDICEIAADHGGFRAPVAIPVHGPIKGISVADVDGDGDGDVVFGRPFAASLQVSPRSFSPLVLSGTPAAEIVLEDFDGDGLPDAAIASLDQLYFAQGRGDGAFDESGPAFDEEDISILRTADFDGDGDRDVVWIGRHVNEVRVAENLGGLEFERPTSWVVNRAVRALVAADLDGDGVADLALARGRAEPLLFLLRDVEAEDFDDKLGPPVGERVAEIVAADFDGDGDNDLAVLEDVREGDPGPTVPDEIGWRVRMLWNAGASEFTEESFLDIDTPALRDLAAGDLDGDGRPDLAVLAERDAPREIEFFTATPGVKDLTRRATLAVGDRLNGIELADLDRDGVMDLVTWSGEGLARVHFGEGGFQFRTAEIRSLPAVPLAAARGEGAGDENAELALAFGNPPVLAILAVDEGGTTVTSELELPFGGIFVRVMPSDIDGNGHVDFVVHSRIAKVVAVAMRDGDTKGFRFTEPTSLPDASIDVAVGDLDGDGLPDLLTRANESVVYLRGLGDGTFASDPVTVAGHEASFAAILDKDGDGDLDVAAASESGETLCFYENRGAGAFTAGACVTVDSLTELATGDLDGDGSEEAMALDASTGRLAVVSRGENPLPSVSYHLLEPRGESLRILDLDADGASDILYRLDGAIGVLYGDGAGGFYASERYGDGETGAALEVLDVDGDGRLDIVSAAWSGFEILFGKGRPAPFSPDCNANGLPDSCDIESGSSADCNGNGKPDECESDCDSNGVLDGCEIGSDPALDCDGNDVLDACELARGDCDGNGLLDVCEIDSHGLLDVDGNGVLDRCESPVFLRADSNHDGNTDLGDAVHVLSFLFTGGEHPLCMESADADNNATVEITDGIAILSWLFLGGTPLAPPGPAPGVCGRDPDPRGSPGDLGCEEYEFCAR